MESILTVEQEDAITNFWNNSPKDTPPLLKDIVNAAFPGMGFDGRGKPGMLVKKFMGKLGWTAKALGPVNNSVAPMQLTSEQQEFIKNNSLVMSVTEMAKQLFPNTTISSNCTPVRVINAFWSTLPNDQRKFDDTPKDYRAPGGEKQAIARVLKYNLVSELDEDNLNPKQRGEIKSLFGYLNNFRFLHTINTMDKEVERELFESEFISYTYGKNDLTPEEVGLCVNLANDTVVGSRVQMQINKLTDLLMSCAEPEDGKKVSISIGLSDSIHNLQTELHQNRERQRKLVDDLQGKRSERLDSRVKENASILSLTEAWKGEVLRVKMLKLAKKREKDELEPELDRLATLDHLKAAIWGIDKNSIIND